MKIAILSMQKIINYGSFLQAYALKKTIEKEGYETEFIDIKKGRRIVNNDIKNNRFINVLKKNPVHTLKQKLQKDKFRYIYSCAFEKEFKIKLDQEYDVTNSKVLVIGSDEVFNCTINSSWGFNEQLFGKGYKIPVVSYAASFGSTTLEKLKEYKVYNDVRKNLKKLKFISVRDDNSKHILDDMGIENSELSLDPTLIYDFHDEIIEQKRFDNYIVVYAYPYRFNDKKEILKIKEFAKKHKLKTIAVGFYQYWCDYNVVVPPFEFLSYMKNADYVITDTFHGTVFSIKYNRQFCTFIRESNNQKISSLLKQFKLDDRKVGENCDITNILEEKINYEVVNKKIRKLSELSKKYIYNSLKKCVENEKK